MHIYIWQALCISKYTYLGQEMDPIMFPCNVFGAYVRYFLLSRPDCSIARNPLKSAALCRKCFPLVS